MKQPTWCQRCHARIADYDVRSVFRDKTFHRHCFVKLVREHSHELRLLPVPGAPVLGRHRGRLR